jgi:glycosyltransferase involved in cell wall biosynthesis
MKNKKKIWLIVIGEPLPNEPGSRALRTRVLARHLAGQGHDVTWWTSDFNHFAKRHHAIDGVVCESGEGYTLRFVRGRAYRRNLSIARFFNHIEIARDFRIQTQTLQSPDIIVCCFPSIELAREAIAFGKRQSVPVIIDVRDLWPDEMKNRLPKALRRLGSLLLQPLERQAASVMREASTLIGVSEAYFTWAMKKSGRPKTDNDGVIPLGYPDSDESASIRRNVNRPKNGQGLNLFFSGSFNNSVDLACLIKAIRQIPDPKLSATLCGDGDNFDQWRALAAQDPRIKFTGWVQGDEIRRHAMLADVGIICYRAESLVAMPNKLFEYMSFGLPVVNSIPGEAADLIHKERFGYNYKAGSVQELRDAIVKMIDNSSGLSEMATASGLCFERSYSAGAVYQRFSMIISDVIEASNSSASINGI